VGRLPSHLPLSGAWNRPFAAFQHCAHGIQRAVNGTITLELMLQALDIGPGDEVIVPAIFLRCDGLWLSARVGATPVFVDIEPYKLQHGIPPVPRRRSPKKKRRQSCWSTLAEPLAAVDRFNRHICQRHGILLLEDRRRTQPKARNGTGAAPGSFWTRPVHSAFRTAKGAD